MARTIPTQSFNWSWLEPVSKVLQIQNFPHTLTQSTSVPRLVKCILIIAMLGCHLWCVRRLLYLPLMFQKPEHLCGLTPGQLHLLPPLLYNIWLLPQQSMTSRWRDKEVHTDGKTNKKMQSAAAKDDESLVYPCQTVVQRGCKVMVVNLMFIQLCVWIHSLTDLQLTR